MIHPSYVEMIDKIRDTAQSHDRCSVVEVMGRKAGYIAINVAVAVGAVACITLEKEYDLDEIAKKMIEAKAHGKTHFIIVVSEGVGKTEYITKTIQDLTGVESRATVLGHVQRGGAPTLRDRVAATKLGYYAVELLEKGVGNRVCGFKQGEVYDVDIMEALSMKKPFEDELYDILYKTAF